MEVVNKVSFVNKINMLMKATSDDDKPIPGYLYDEVNKISYESHGYCLNLLEFLVSQLDKRSCHVKLKVLKLMSHLVEQGHPYFRQGLRRQANGIREATKFSGPPDPLHGTVPYLVVRQMAQSLSEVLFDVDDNTEKESETKTVRPSSMPAGMGNVQGRGRMEGFGSSPQHHSKSTGRLLRDSIGTFLDKFTETPLTDQVFIRDSDKQSSNFAPVQLDQDFLSGHTTSTSSRPDNHKPGSSSVSSSSSLPVKPSRVPHHIPGRAGGGWDDDDGDDDVRYGELDRSSSSSGVGIGLKSATITSSFSSSLSSSSSSSHLSSKETKVSNNEIASNTRRDCDDYSSSSVPPDCETERQLVCDMINNTRPLPTRSDLDAFIKKCSSMNCDKVIDLINHHLSNDAQLHTQLLCLYMLEWFCCTDYINLNLMTSVCKQSLLHLYNTTAAATTTTTTSGVDSNSCSERQLVHSKCRKIIRILEKLTVHKTILPVSVVTPADRDKHGNAKTSPAPPLPPPPHSSSQSSSSSSSPPQPPSSSSSSSAAASPLSLSSLSSLSSPPKDKKPGSEGDDGTSSDDKMMKASSSSFHFVDRGEYFRVAGGSNRELAAAEGKISEYSPGWKRLVVEGGDVVVRDDAKTEVGVAAVATAATTTTTTMVTTDNELSDVSSQPSVGSEFSMLSEDQLEVGEG